MAQVVKEVRFLAVARKSDKVILASRTHTLGAAGTEFVDKVKNVLGSPGWASVTTDKLSLDDGGNMFHMLMDEAGRTYVTITSKAYPSRFIYGTADGSTRGILTELKRQVIERFGDVSLTCPANGLNSKASNMLKALCDEFNDLKNIDKIAGVQAKVDQVTGIMQKNIEIALKNTDRIEDIDEKAVVLADSANKFKTGASALKRKMRCRYWKMIILFSTLAAAVIIIIIVSLTAGR